MIEAGTRSGTTRGRPRFSGMLRTRSSALVASGAGLMVAAIFGIQLGQSAVSEIDPVHFQGPAERPIGIDPAAAEAAEPDPYSQAYGWGDSGAPGPICGGDCEAGEARAATAFDGPIATRELSAPYWRDATPITELRPWRPGEVPYRGLSVERYMHYPVTQAQADGAAATPTAPEPVAPDPAASAPAAAPAPGEERVDD
jgi:hypothetical protein